MGDEQTEPGGRDQPIDADQPVEPVEPVEPVDAADAAEPEPAPRRSFAPWIAVAVVVALVIAGGITAWTLRPVEQTASTPTLPPR